MGIPKSVNQLLPEEEVPVILSYKNKKWRVKYQGNHAFKRFDSSWKYFVQDNNLKVEDGSVLNSQSIAKTVLCSEFKFSMVISLLSCVIGSRVNYYWLRLVRTWETMRVKMNQYCCLDLYISRM